MRPIDDILPFAIDQIGLAVTALIGWTGVHIAEHVPSRWKIRKASTRLKALETLVRRLIMLLALQLDLQPDRPRGAQAPPGIAPTETASENPNTINDEVEFVAFPKVRQRSLSLVPRLMLLTNGRDLSHLPRGTTPPHIMAKRLACRIIALQRVLNVPDAYATRLARHLQKQRRSGEPAPLLIPSPVPAGLPSEMKLLQGGLALQLRDALKAWDTS
ncbi:MAG: hypothetical protein AAFS13_07385 [Pseudomonadota bacterium]